MNAPLKPEFALVTWQRPSHMAAMPGRPEKLCFTTLSLAVETMGVRLGVVKQSFFGLQGQYGRRVTRANGGGAGVSNDWCIISLLHLREPGILLLSFQ